MNILTLLSFGDSGWGTSLAMAMGTTLLVTLAALATGAVFGALVACAKLSPRRPLRVLGASYSTLFRGVPELLIIYLFFFGGATLATAVGHWFGGQGYIDLPPFWVGALAVGLISGSYQAEVYRGAFLAITPGEVEAGLAFGLSRPALLRHVVAPQVVRLALPGLGNVWQMTLKDSALVSVIGLVELMRASQVAAGSTRQYFTFYIIAGVGYLLLTGLSSRLFQWAEARLQRSQRPLHPGA